MSERINRRALLTRGTALGGSLLVAGFAPGVAAGQVPELIARRVPGFTADRRAFFVAFIATVWAGTAGPRDPALAEAAADAFEATYDDWPLTLQHETDVLFDDIQYGMKGRRFSDLSPKRRGDFLLTALRDGPWGEPTRDERSREQRKNDWRRVRGESRAAQRDHGAKPWYSGLDSHAPRTGSAPPRDSGDLDGSLALKIVRAAATVTNGPGAAPPALCVEG